MKIAISAETTVDLTKELLEEFRIHTTPFTILLGDRVCLDGEITTEEIIEFVKKTNVLPKTSAINESQYSEHFENLLKEYDAIIHFSLSSEMSSAYNNAVLASKKFNNVFVIDSRTLSTGIALLAIYASKLVSKGLDIGEILSSVDKRIPFVEASFIPNRLDYLYKGGRCSSLAYFGANLFQIKPQIIVKEGKMISGKKYRGKYDKVVEKYVKELLDEYKNIDLEEVFITYTTIEKEIGTQVQEAQTVPYRINPKRNTTTHILITLKKIKLKKY